MKKNNLKEKTILYIVHDYNNFQKDPIEEASKYFKKVYVLVRYKPLSWFAKYIPIKSIKKYEDSFVVDLNNVPENVKVIRTPVWYLPFGIFYKLAGELHYKSVLRTIKKYNIKFDLIHSHFIWSAGFVGMKLKEKYQVPFIVTGHGFDVYQLPFDSSFWEFQTKKILSYADYIVTVSKKNEEILTGLNVEKSKIKILHNSFDPKLFFPIESKISRENIKISLYEEMVLSVGNFEEVKGHKDLINAIKILDKKHPKLVCYIVGGGSLEKNLLDEIRKLKLEKKVFLVSHLPHDQISRWMNACDLFVLPSIAESFGIVQIEAFACGKPVVATKNEGSKEIILSRDYGYLCNIGDSEDLARNMEKALKKKWDKEKIIRYSDNFKQESINNKLINLYKNILQVE